MNIEKWIMYIEKRIIMDIEVNYKYWKIILHVLSFASK